MISSYQIVIQSEAKDLKSVGLCIQILHYVSSLRSSRLSSSFTLRYGQNDTT